jgi:ribonuclease P protein component
MKLNLFVKLKKNCEIQTVFEKGHSIYGRYIVVYFLRNSFQNVRIAFCVGRKIGNAVKRNRIKRLLREAVRAVNCNLSLPEWDILLVARGFILTANLESIIQEIEHILVKASILTPCK